MSATPEAGAALAALAATLNASPAASLAGRIRQAALVIPGRLVLTTSFGLEDQVLTHAIAESGEAVELATLDTGRLFPETYDVWAATEARYGVSVRAFYPQTEAVEALVDRQGIAGFRRSVPDRMRCCAVRKVEPLGRAMVGAAGWITGLRADQSAHRGGTPFAEVDTGRGLVKINPLFDWSRDRAADFATLERVPVNALHGRGFPSIGCAPCTRAVGLGEDERAGRWWWENEAQGDEASQECGLHLSPDGRLVRGPKAEKVSA